LQIRPGIFNLILYDKHLFQQFVVDTYVKIESSRLDFIRNNQDIVRADLYQGLDDSYRTGVEEANEVGKRTVLSPTYKITCPEQYDAIITAELPEKKKYPDLFKMVTKHMMHGPCGVLNPTCLCTKDYTSCKNYYP
jgi:hypothetical protein